MIVVKTIKTPIFRNITVKSIYIDKLPMQIQLSLQFFLDTINEKTIFILVLEYEDDFFTDLIKNDFTNEDKLEICKNVENYLNQSLKNLETGCTCILNSTLEKVKKYVLYPKLFYQIISKEMIFTLNEKEISLDRKYELFSKSEKTSEITPLTVLIVEGLVVSEKYLKVIYKTYKKYTFPNIKITLIIKELGNNKCFFWNNIKPNEPISHEIKCFLISFWKKRMLDFCNFFEKNQKY